MENNVSIVVILVNERYVHNFEAALSECRGVSVYRIHPREKVPDTGTSLIRFDLSFTHPYYLFELGCIFTEMKFVEAAEKLDFVNSSPSKLSDG